MGTIQHLSSEAGEVHQEEHQQNQPEAKSNGQRPIQSAGEKRRQGILHEEP